MLWWYERLECMTGLYVVIQVVEPRMAFNSCIISRILMRVFSKQVVAGSPKRAASVSMFLMRS